MTGDEGGGGGADGGVRLRVLTYNVRSLRDDAAAVAAVLRALAPDLACIQEAPRFLFSRRRCAQLAEAARLTVLSGGRPANGNLLLGGPRVRLLTASQVRLPRSGRRHRRSLALATVQVDGVPVRLAGTHLSLDPIERLTQARDVVLRLGAAGAAPPTVLPPAVLPPTVLGADVNDVPGSAVWEVLTGLLRDARAVAPCGGELTFPARLPRRRIDAVFVSGEITILGCGAPEDLPDPAAATDHLPVLADLLLPRVTDRQTTAPSSP